jgi:hypothetical protein
LARWSQRDQDDFYRELDRVSESPVARSRVASAPEVSRYVLRSFEFGVGLVKIAYFEFNASTSTMRVSKCAMSVPKRVRGQPPGDDPAAP